MMKKYYDEKNKNILVTGGAGFIGRNLVKSLLTRYSPKVVRALDTNENGLQKLKRQLNGHPNLRTFIGSIRDRNRLRRAIQNIDVVFHLAAYKHVDLLEASPFAH